jgi:hypothetical protein
MEGLLRLVSDSFARHGVDVPMDCRRLHWSPWFRCQSSFDLMLVPNDPGLFAIAEEIAPPGELATASGKRMLALLDISEADDVCLALARLFAPTHPLRARLAQGQCFVRFVIVGEEEQRRSAAADLKAWVASAAEIAFPGTELNGNDSRRTAAKQENPAPQCRNSKDIATEPSGGAHRFSSGPFPAGF